MKFAKMLVVLCTAVLFASALHAENAPKAVPGAVLSIYSLTNTPRPAPEAEPLLVLVDEYKNFSKDNLGKKAETKKFKRQNIFMVWKGYVSVPAKGIYTFSLSYEHESKGYANVTILQVNGKDFLGISHDKKKTVKLNDSGSLSLEQGEYEITILHKSIFYDEFSLSFWNKTNPLKKISIIPATMVHAE